MIRQRHGRPGSANGGWTKKTEYRPGALSAWRRSRPFLAHCESAFDQGLDGGGDMPEQENSNQRLTLPQVFGSVLSSFFGVQKNATRERDFRRGRARDFIIVGVALTLLFILTVWGVVQLVMRFAIPA